jgi:alpha-glucosidase
VWGGWTVFPDFTSARTREWWGKQYRFYVEKGVAGFWHDMNEPALVAGWGEMTLPRDTQHAMDGVGGDHNEAHNVYGLLMNRAGYEGLRKLRPAVRPFIVSRSGWAGGQRYAANWTGDVSTSWESLRMTLPLVLNMSLSGIVYAGPDIGGFSGQPDTELFVRWFQLGAFLPFFRTHSAFYIPAREPWRWGDAALGILRDVLKLRYRLMPYWYTLAWQAQQTGEPLVRPLFYTDPTDNKLWEVSDAFLLGSDLLVAPVLDEGIRRRKVTLPQNNAGWYDFWNDKHYPNEQEIEVEAGLECTPLFARAGSIIPIVENQELTLLAYPANGVCRGMLYSDAGDGYDIFRVDSFELKIDNNECSLNWTTLENSGYEWEYNATRVRIAGYGEWEIAPGENRFTDY